jgi:hypothetical protein
MTMGCAVDFTAGDRVVRFRSGDAIIFNGGRAHGVMHGVRTCPANPFTFVAAFSRSRELHSASRSQGAREHWASLAAQAAQRAHVAAAAPAMTRLAADGTDLGLK